MEDPRSLSETTAAAQRLIAAVEQVIAGNNSVVESTVVCLLAEGNLLLEGVPGVGKTMLARAVARATGGTCHRIQGAPDLLPFVWSARSLSFLFVPAATENPVEHHGTYPLPEGQLDRFTMAVSVGYPSAEEERGVVTRQLVRHPIEDLEPVLGAGDVVRHQQVVR